MNIILSDDQAKRLSKHLDDFIFSGMADIAEAINYQIDWAELDTEFKIINDPDYIPTSGSDYLFYIKNIGGNEIATSNETFQLFVDGDLVAIANYNFSDSSIQPDEVTTIYVDNSEISAADQTLRVVGPQAIEDEFTFTI